jgi:hypothetical protein
VVEKKGANLKGKRKGSTAPSKAKGNSKCKASGGPTGQVPKKGCSEKFCRCCKAHDGPFTTQNTIDCLCYDSNGRPLEAAAVNPSEFKKLYKKSGGNKGTQRPKRHNSQRDSDQYCARTEDVLAITLRQEFLIWCKAGHNSTENKAILEQTLSVSTLHCNQNCAFSRIAPTLTSPLSPKFAQN